MTVHQAGHGHERVRARHRPGEAEFLGDGDKPMLSDALQRLRRRHRLAERARDRALVRSVWEKTA